MACSWTYSNLYLLPPKITDRGKWPAWTNHPFREVGFSCANVRPSHIWHASELNSQAYIIRIFISSELQTTDMKMGEERTTDKFLFLVKCFVAQCTNTSARHGMIILCFCCYHDLQISGLEQKGGKCRMSFILRQGEAGALMYHLEVSCLMSVHLLH